ncbi:hypothetical protein ATANTOWER_007928 [Ataeniobius toweri]|uniref:Transmembrane protein n=1 Tax=Ataeniobius toweri TaxID=208326 RepID=A0ABU7AMV5_9TELE|nr:hypothetical protein [Ataeniobius toweri]
MAAVTHPMTRAVISTGQPSSFLLSICPHYFHFLFPSLLFKTSLLQLVKLLSLLFGPLLFFLLWRSGFSGLMKLGGLRAAFAGLIRILIKERTKPRSSFSTFHLLFLSLHHAQSHKVAFLITAAHHKKTTHYTQECVWGHVLVFTLFLFLFLFCMIFCNKTLNSKGRVIINMHISDLLGGFLGQ